MKRQSVAWKETSGISLFLAIMSHLSETVLVTTHTGCMNCFLKLFVLFVALMARFPNEFPFLFLHIQRRMNLTTARGNKLDRTQLKTWQMVWTCCLTGIYLPSFTQIQLVHLVHSHHIYLPFIHPPVVTVMLSKHFELPLDGFTHHVLRLRLQIDHMCPFKAI